MHIFIVLVVITTFVAMGCAIAFGWFVGFAQGKYWAPDYARFGAKFGAVATVTIFAVAKFGFFF